MSDRHFLPATVASWMPAFFAWVGLGCCVAGPVPAMAVDNPPVHLDVRGYTIEGNPLLPTNVLTRVLVPYAGTNLSLDDLGKAARDLQIEYGHQGYTNVSIAIAPSQITGGIVTMNVFEGAYPQILVAGRRYSSPTNAAAISGNSSPTTNAVSAVSTATNAAPAGAAAAAAGANTAAATNAAAATTAKAVPKFTVRAYEIRGDTLFSAETLASIFSKYTGTNIGVAEIVKAGSDLQLEYRSRGYPTVSVVIPPQQITNGIVKIQVFEGILSDIVITNNHFFSDANIRRALPSVRTNTVLLRPVFQAELDAANANQDRQIYPQIEPGPRPNTTKLVLDVKDRLPLHGKVEFDNQNTPDTPDLRINTSVVYNNLWQHEHSLGLQYSFSPEQYKPGESWNFYDTPAVANYSAFYRLPLGNPDQVEDIVANDVNFGYNEGTRRFQLPPSAGGPQLNFYASRSTIDTGVSTLFSQVIYDVPGVRQVSRQDVQEDSTVTSDIGARLSSSLPMESDKVRFGFSGGVDYKTYELTSYKTNTFKFTEITVSPTGVPNPPIVSTVASPVPTTVAKLEYMPISGHLDASLADPLGTTTFGLGASVNTWYSGSLSNLQMIAGSTAANGSWFTITPSMSRDLNIFTNWVLSVRADGQWADQPLISNEQFGIGGVNSIRGYHEGELFGDSGWQFLAEQKTPPYVVGMVYDNQALTVRGSIYMGYGQVYLQDPPRGADPTSRLWGTGFGTVAAVGSHWQARLLFSWPLISTSTTEAFQPRFDFTLTAQF